MAELAIKGGKPVRSESFPSWPVWDSREEKALLGVLKSSKWWYGEKVAEFEKKFASFQNAKYGVTCMNGSVGLEVSLLSLGIGAGDEVIVPPYTFIATVSSVLKVNAIPGFADIDLETGNISTEEVEMRITDRTKAIIPVHFAGLPCDMDSLDNIAKKHSLRIVEDACHSWGSQWKGKGTGAIGDCGVFSFQMSKNITSGEGGIILTDNKGLAELARSYVNCGRKKNKPWYEHHVLGGNYRMTEFQAAILLAQLTRLGAQVEKREGNGIYLDEKLKDIPGIRIVKRDGRITRRSYHMYVFRYIKEEFGNLPRGKFIEALNAEGIPSTIGYPYPLYKNPLMLDMGYSKVSCPNAEKMCQKAVWLSHAMLLAERKDMDNIVEAIKKVSENVRELL